ncbi:MAG: phosphoglycerate dehydrogenase [Gammaproteobacteria bacterium]|nr:MAG: phosphoglycerate dehydrogenase [Gammaproteobacteria bacterium]
MKKIKSLDKHKIRILLLEGVHESAVSYLESQGYSNIQYEKKSLTGDDLLEAIKDAHFIGIRSRTQITEQVLCHAKKLSAVGCFCIGTNQVDLTACQKRGIPVFNAPFANTRSVAELVLAESILLMRGIPEKNAVAHRGGWQKTAHNSYEVRGKNLGIIGYGHIGTQLGILAESLGMKVYFYDIANQLSLGNATACETMEELLSIADVVTLHVPETKQTQMMFGAEQFAQMKDNAILLNASRGSVVDIDALSDALRSKKISGAAIDVFPVEPKSTKEEFISPLREFDNVILTPHIGGSTQEAQYFIGLEVTEKIVRYSDNGSTSSAVNFPKVTLPEHKNSHRIFHIHHNKPGILVQINEVFAKNNINISAQFLQTFGETGYVVTDVDESWQQQALDDLKAIEGTIRTRILY